jgi:hypothetical protein
VRSFYVNEFLKLIIWFIYLFLNSLDRCNSLYSAVDKSECTSYSNFGQATNRLRFSFENNFIYCLFILFCYVFYFIHFIYLFIYLLVYWLFHLFILLKTGLYPPAAHLNHSCRPTLVYHFQDGAIVMRYFIVYFKFIHFTAAPVSPCIAFFIYIYIYIYVCVCLQNMLFKCSPGTCFFVHMFDEVPAVYISCE